MTLGLTTVSDTQFDISTFKVQLPLQLDPNYQVDMNGLRFYGGQAWKETAGTYTFGADSPTYVLIGLTGPTFTPMLLAYGTVTLGNNNNGIDFYNYAGWTQGLYTVANQLAVGTTPAQVAGGMTIQPLDGGFYTDSLVNTGTNFTITAFANGTVTTSEPNGLTVGQNLEFIGLVNPTGGVSDGTGFEVATIISTTQFTIAALDKHDVSQAAAGGGSVTSIASPSDSENWGALVPNGQPMQLSTNNQRTTNTFYAAFTPSRILLTKSIDAVPEPVLQFSGVQTIEYQRSNITAGFGYQSGNDAQYLQINFDGYYEFINATEGTNTAMLTFAYGATPSANLITTKNGVAGGRITIVSQNQQDPLAAGDWVHFTNLNIPTASDGSAPPLIIGTPYQVDNVDGAVFQLKDPVLGTPGFGDVISSVATLVKESSILDIDQDKNGLTVVETAHPHGLLPGDAIIFNSLLLEQGTIDESQTYYVTAVYEDTTSKQITSFSFAEERGGVYNPPVLPKTSLPGGRVTIPLGKVGGFDAGGDGTVTCSFNGGFQLGDWVKPTDVTLGISGSFAASYLWESGTTIAGILSAKGDSETSAGVVLQWVNGDFSVTAGAFNISASITLVNSENSQPKLGLSLSNISGSVIKANGTETWSFNGSVSATIPSLGWSGTANFGHGEVNGLTLLIDSAGNRFVQECSASFVADHLSPPKTQSGFTQTVSIMGWNVSADYNRDPAKTSDWSLLIGGTLTLAIGDSRPDPNGNWKSSVDAITINTSPGVLELYEKGVKFLPGRYEIDVNGPFKILGKLSVVAKSLKFIYQSADPATQTDEQILLSGGVAFPDLRNASVQFGNDGASGGLEIDVTDGTWKLNGFRVTIPSFSACSLFQLQNFVLGFSETTDANGDPDYDIEAGGQVQLLSGKGMGLNIGVHIKFDIDNGKLKIIDIGVSLRNMNPGIMIEPVDGFLTDIAFEFDDDTSISVDLLFGAVFGDKITVGAKEYSMVQAIVNGQYKYKDINVTGPS